MGPFASGTRAMLGEVITPAEETELPHNLSHGEIGRTRFQCEQAIVLIETDPDVGAIMHLNVAHFLLVLVCEQRHRVKVDCGLQHWRAEAHRQCFPSIPTGGQLGAISIKNATPWRIGKNDWHAIDDCVGFQKGAGRREAGDDKEVSSRLDLGFEDLMWIVDIDAYRSAYCQTFPLNRIRPSGFDPGLSFAWCENVFLVVAKRTPSAGNYVETIG